MLLAQETAVAAVDRMGSEPPRREVIGSAVQSPHEAAVEGAGRDPGLISPCSPP
jgi:hypothetical protein